MTYPTNPQPPQPNAGGYIPPSPPHGPYQYVGPRPPHKGHGLRNALIIVGVGCLVLLGGCLALIGNAANTITKDQQSATSDVTIQWCKNVNDMPTAQLSITNSASVQRSYLVTVAFLDASGTTQVDSGTAAVNDLAPGQAANPQAVAIAIEPEAFGTCKITNVSTL